MNLTSLRYLVALHSHRHFGRAAQACHITQPALSNAIRVLEEEVGAPLVKRGNSYAGLTAEGERVLASGRRMLREHELLLQELKSGSADPAGALRLGAVPTAIPVAARFAALLQARWPGIVPTVRSMSSQQMEQGLDDFSLDLGLGFLERLGRRTAHFHTLPQYGEQYFLVRRTEDTRAPLRLGRPVSWKSAGALPLCLLTPDMHNRGIVQAAFAQAGVELRPAMETNSILTLGLSVLAGQVCSVLPGALVAAAGGYAGLQAQPLTRPKVVTPVGFMTLASATPSRVLQAALEFAVSKPWSAQLAAHGGALASFKR